MFFFNKRRTKRQKCHLFLCRRLYLLLAFSLGFVSPLVVSILFADDAFELACCCGCGLRIICPFWFWLTTICLTWPPALDWGCRLLIICPFRLTTTRWTWPPALANRSCCNCWAVKVAVPKVLVTPPPLRLTYLE